MKKELKTLIIVFCSTLSALFIIYLAFLKTETSIEPTTVTSNKIIQAPPLIANVSTAHSFSVGPENAKVTVVEFFDPECESCAAVAPYIKKEMSYYKDQVRWIFRYMAYHHNSELAIRILEASRQQNLFLEVQNFLFENQKTWGEQKTSVQEILFKLLPQIKNLNIEKLKIDMNNPKTTEMIAIDKADGEKYGVTGTPTFFVNGILLQELNLDNLIAQINKGLETK